MKNTFTPVGAICNALLKKMVETRSLTAFNIWTSSGIGNAEEVINQMLVKQISVARYLMIDVNRVGLKAFSVLCRSKTLWKQSIWTKDHSLLYNLLENNGPQFRLVQVEQVMNCNQGKKILIPTTQLQIMKWEGLFAV